MSLVVLAGCSVDGRDVDIALEMCATNGGVDSVYGTSVFWNAGFKCVNGATFDYNDLPN